MAYTSDGAPPAAIIAAKATETVNGLNDEQVKRLALEVAGGLTYDQAIAKVAPKAAPACCASHQGKITALAATKTAAHPQWAELAH